MLESFCNGSLLKERHYMNSLSKEQRKTLVRKKSLILDGNARTLT